MFQVGSGWRHETGIFLVELHNSCIRNHCSAYTLSTYSIKFWYSNYFTFKWFDTQNNSTLMIIHYLPLHSFCSTLHIQSCNVYLTSFSVNFIITLTPLTVATYNIKHSYHDISHYEIVFHHKVITSHTIHSTWFHTIPYASLHHLRQSYHHMQSSLLTGPHPTFTYTTSFNLCTKVHTSHNAHITHSYPLNPQPLHSITHTHTTSANQSYALIRLYHAHSPLIP